MRAVDELVATFGRGDRDAGAQLLALLDALDALLATRPETRLDAAEALAAGAAKHGVDARELVTAQRRILTSWNAEAGTELDDYSGRIWHGLVGRYYRARLEAWLRSDTGTGLSAELDGIWAGFMTEQLAVPEAAVVREASRDLRQLVAAVVASTGEGHERDRPIDRDRGPESATLDIDLLPPARAVVAILAEDALAVAAAQRAAGELGAAVEETAARLRAGGRLHYFGAGASGRIAVLDATELTPTYGAERGLVTAHFPGGTDALVDSSLDLEDARSLGAEDAGMLTAEDVAFGITASGGTPTSRALWMPHGARRLHDPPDLHPGTRHRR